MQTCKRATAASFRSKGKSSEFGFAQHCWPEKPLAGNGTHASGRAQNASFLWPTSRRGSQIMLVADDWLEKGLVFAIIPIPPPKHRSILIYIVHVQCERSPVRVSERSSLPNKNQCCPPIIDGYHDPDFIYEDLAS